MKRTKSWWAILYTGMAALSGFFTIAYGREGRADLEAAYMIAMGVWTIAAELADRKHE